MKRDTFIFDLDGTILDTLPDLVVLTNRCLVREGFPGRTSAEILSFVGNGLRSLMEQAVPEGTPAERVEAVAQAWRDLYPTYPNDLTRPYPSVSETLAALAERGCKLGVFSNKFDGGVHQIIDQCLPGVFGAAHGECAEFPRKPDPTGILRTIAELESAPERTVYVGDSPTDIEAARRAGTMAVGVSWGYHTADEMRQASPDVLVSDFSELLAIS